MADSPAMLRDARRNGTDVTPRLRLLRPLGRGGMGVLWVASHRGLENEVVVKFLKEDVAGDPSAAQRFAREAASAARVKSPYVVQILDHGVSEGTPFIVMELLEGRDLRMHLVEQGPLSRDETVTIVRQLAMALAKTHEVGLVHRDVKPSNVFLCSVGGDVFVKLLDFGLALPSLSVTASQPCAGTPPYMSPEQMLGANLDSRSDVWSLGALAFECLTGTRAFAGETLGSIALAVHTLPLPRPTEFGPDLPAALNTWFAQACSRSREDRFSSAMGAATALARALSVDLRGMRGSKTAMGQVDETVTDDFALTRVSRGNTPRRSARGWTPANATMAGIAGATVIAATTFMYPGRAASRSNNIPAGIEAVPCSVALAKASDPPANSQALVPDEPSVAADAASALTPKFAPPVRPLTKSKESPRTILSAIPAPAASIDSSLHGTSSFYEMPDERR